MTDYCSVCPRKCSAERQDFSPAGICSSPILPSVSRAAPHYGEEPCISGTRGSGAVFFTGCNLKCVFCQNYEISRGNGGKILSIDELSDTFLRLQDTGVHNINLVTPTHFTLSIVKALEKAKLDIPVVWNSSGYDSVESLKLLEGLVQVYMPDYKYAKSEPAKKYSSAPDYPEVAAKAIIEMYRQRGPAVFDDDGMLTSGLLIRHLVLPQNELNTMDVIDFVSDNFPRGSVVFSLMGQYTPMPGSSVYSELNSRVDRETYEMLCYYLDKMNIYPGYTQELESATDELIPDFDLTGLN